MRVTVDIDADLLELLRTEARRRAISFKSMLGEVIRRSLYDRSAPTEPFFCPTFDMGMPAGVINLDKALALSAMLESDEIDSELHMRK
jgi:hypothetical protein